MSGRGVFVSLGIRQKAPFVRTAKLLRKLLDTVVPIPNVKQRGEAGFSQFENGHGFERIRRGECLHAIVQRWAEFQKRKK